MAILWHAVVHLLPLQNLYFFRIASIVASFSPKSRSQIANIITASDVQYLSRGRARGTSMDSLYDVLGVSSRANETAIRTAFRKAAKSYHPDLNAGNPTAELQFRQIVAAYELLKDPLQREAYDQQLKDDRRARARRIASPLISGVVSGGLVALTMWWFNTHTPPESAQAPRVAVAEINEPAGQHTAADPPTAAATATNSDTAAPPNDGTPGDAVNGPMA